MQCNVHSRYYGGWGINSLAEGGGGIVDFFNFAVQTPFNDIGALEVMKPAHFVT